MLKISASADRHKQFFISICSKYVVDQIGFDESDILSDIKALKWTDRINKNQKFS